MTLSSSVVILSWDVCVSNDKDIQFFFFFFVVPQQYQKSENKKSKGRQGGERDRGHKEKKKEECKGLGKKGVREEKEGEKERVIGGERMANGEIGKILFTLFLMDGNDSMRDNSLLIENKNTIMPQNLCEQQHNFPEHGLCHQRQLTGTCQDQHQLPALASTLRASDGFKLSEGLSASPIWFL